MSVRRNATCLVALFLLSSFSVLLLNEESEAEVSVLLDIPESMEARNAAKSIAFNTTWAKANSPYYQIYPITVQKGIRLTIEPGVIVYMNTTNSSITVHGELHAEGTVTSPIEFGINPAVTRNCTHGWWSGIKSDSPNSGKTPLLLRNVTIWGTRQAGSSCSSAYDMLRTGYFGRSNSFSALDNLTLYDGGRVYFQNYGGTSAKWQINNITIHNMTYVEHSSNQFHNRCGGGSWNGEVSLTDVNEVELYQVGYASMSNSATYCLDYSATVSNWTFTRITSRLYARYYDWTSSTAARPLFFQGTFTDVAKLDLRAESYTTYQAMKHSTFTDTRVEITPSSGSSRQMEMSNNTFIDSQIVLKASSGSSSTGLIMRDSTFTSTKAPPTTGSWTSYYIDGNDYGKWIIQNNSFTPANGWKNLRYTYNIGNMRAPYNWWGSASNTTIDSNISDYLDSNGGGWVNYSPFWKSAAMTQLDWNGTTPSSLPLPQSVSGTLIFNQTMLLNNSPYYLIGPLSVAPGVRLTIEPGVKVYMNTTNSSITAYGELHAEGTVTSPIEFGINPAVTRNCTHGWWSGIKSDSPNSGKTPLLLRNVTIWGTRQAGSSCSSAYDMLRTGYFGRSNSFSALDNLTLYDGGRVYFQNYGGTSAKWQINNITIHNMTYVEHSSNQFHNRCGGGSWNGEVSLTDVNEVELYQVGYASMSNSATYCLDYSATVSNWTFTRITSRLYARYYDWTSSTAARPLFFQGTFTDVAKLDLRAESYTTYQAMKHSTFTDTRVEITPSSGSSRQMEMSNNTFIDSQIVLKASSGSSSTGLIMRDSTFTSTKAPPTTGSWTSYYIDGNDYGKWIIQNNSFTPANGWKNLRYTYGQGNMIAPKNWWGSNQSSVIDANIQAQSLIHI